MYLELEEKQAMRNAKLKQKKQAKKLAKFQQFHGQDENNFVDTSTPTDFLGMPRNGDWICVRCTNFNYSFRESCNKCGLMQYEHHYFSNNFAPNTIDWNQVQTCQNMPPPVPFEITQIIQNTMQ